VSQQKRFGVAEVGRKQIEEVKKFISVMAQSIVTLEMFSDTIDRFAS
jgi:hypothetical protein